MARRRSDERSLGLIKSYSLSRSRASSPKGGAHAHFYVLAVLDLMLSTSSVACADSVSLRLGHATALTVHRTVIHYRVDTALPSRGSLGRFLRTLRHFIASLLREVASADCAEVGRSLSLIKTYSLSRSRASSPKGGAHAQSKFFSDFKETPQSRTNRDSSPKAAPMQNKLNNQQTPESTQQGFRGHIYSIHQSFGQNSSLFSENISNASWTTSSSQLR